MTRTMGLLEQRVSMTEDRVSGILAYSRGMVEVPTTTARPAYVSPQSPSVVSFSSKPEENSGEKRTPLAPKPVVEEPVFIESNLQSTQAGLAAEVAINAMESSDNYQYYM